MRPKILSLEDLSSKFAREENNIEVPEPGRLYDEDLHEDRSIIQPDGSRACAAWELVGKGYHLV